MMAFSLSLQTVTIGEQRISLFVPDALAIKNAYESGAIPFPYWSKVWPAAVALAQFILEHPQYTQNKEVLELGAGLGLPSLIAARYATHVLCTDHSEEAVATLAQSATCHNKKNFKAAVVDWHRVPPNLRADVLLLSDVNYELSNFEALAKIIDKFLNNDAVVLLSTPQRLVAKAFVAPFSTVCIQSKEYNIKQCEGNADVTVMALQKE